MAFFFFHFRSAIRASGESMHENDESAPLMEPLIPPLTAWEGGEAPSAQRSSSCWDSATCRRHVGLRANESKCHVSWDTFKCVSTRNWENNQLKLWSHVRVDRPLKYNFTFFLGRSWTLAWLTEQEVHLVVKQGVLVFLCCYPATYQESCINLHSTDIDSWVMTSYSRRCSLVPLPV